MQVGPFTLFWSLVGGILPALFWLWFWLKEDEHPEPRRLITIAFIGGMIAVPFVVPFQGYVKSHLTDPLFILVLWAAIEEVFKFIAAYITGLSKKADDEPVDPIIYMMTTALGFAALENVLFILAPAKIGDLYTTLLTGNLRFVGATLLHLVSSCAVGVSLGLAFYKSRLSRLIHIFVGLGIAIALHSTVNLLIMNSTGMGAFAVFFGVWVAIIILALFFEKVKSLSVNQ